MKNELLGKISGRFLTNENINDILKEYDGKAESLTEKICNLAKGYNKLDDIQQENLINCISAFFQLVSNDISSLTTALDEKQYGDKYYATHWQKKYYHCDWLNKLSKNIVDSATESKNKNFAYMVLLKHKHYVSEKCNQFEDSFYIKLGQIDIPSGLPSYHSKNRIECKEQIGKKMDELREVFKDGDVMMLADIILQDKEISSLMHQIEQGEYYMRDILKHYVGLEKRQMDIEVQKGKIKNGEMNEKDFDDNFFDL